MKILLCPNGYTGEQAEQAKQCIRSLEKNQKHECALMPQDSILLFEDESKTSFSPDESDIIVALGGDGSILRAAQIAIQYNKPLIGINSGRLGYLSCIPFTEIERFNELFSSFECSERLLLELEYDHKKAYALNDVVIAKSNFGSTVDLSVKVDSIDIGKVRGDGLIIATPTGSTAYNLSAGGPVLDYGVSAIVITPICSHISSNHPIALNDQRVITVSERNSSAEIYIDGKRIGKIGKEITVKKSSKTLRLYSTQGQVGTMNLVNI